MDRKFENMIIGLKHKLYSGYRRVTLEKDEIEYLAKICRDII